MPLINCFILVIGDYFTTIWANLVENYVKLFSRNPNHFFVILKMYTE